MPNYRRLEIPGATIFFTVALRDRPSNLLVREVATLRRAFSLTRSERPFAVGAWVVLPDHLHCIWTLPQDDADYATRWRLIKSRFSRELPIAPRRRSETLRSERGIWQRRFWEHHIRNQADLEAHIAYCWNNPVKHGLVSAPEDWPFSSIHTKH